MKMTLYRLLTDEEGTIGVLFKGAMLICYMGELPWRDNRSNISRIPSGSYKVVYLARSGSGRYRDVYHVRNVPHRTGVLIHSGNWEGDTSRGLKTHTHGCLLPGSRIGRLSGQRAVLASKSAMRKVHAAVGRKNFTLEIIDV
jgi:hypothetical protein